MVLHQRMAGAAECDAAFGLGTVRDWRDEAIRWRRKAEQVERLVKLGSFEVDLDSGALSWSDGTYAIFGLLPGSSVTVEQALGYYDPQVRTEINCALEAAKLSGQPYDLTVPFLTDAGLAGWARMIAQVEHANGQTRLVGVIRDITSERDAEERLRVQANQDILTGLPNRRAFQAHLEQNATLRLQGGSALCIVDVDRFKAVNDVHGHAVGDRLLQAVGRRLAEAVRTTDFVARLGGDEFAIVLHGLRRRAELGQRAAHLVQTVRQPLDFDGVTIEPSISVGACYRGSQANVDTLLKQADIALYKAKLSGRDQFCVFQPSLRKEVDDHSRLLDDVRIGLSRNQFEVHYQPIIDLRTRIVRGWEALIRWRHPSKGLLLPGRFLPALSDPKTSVSIDDYVLATSLRQMRQWLDSGVPVTCAGVNISEAQLKRPGLVSSIVELLRRYQLTPDRLKIEVLETAFVGRSTREVAATIEQLARLGVVSALDDFGTGHASLTHLKQFRVERIKIDRSFVANLCVDGFDQAIVRCMITLGKDLGIRITAEGIETVEQLRILRRLGCDCGQGFLFGRPMPPDDVPDFLERWHNGVADELFDAGEAPGLAPLRVVEFSI